MRQRFVLILAGGRGERFWPWSQPSRPKQLLPLASGGRTLLGATFERALRLVPRERVLVMTALDLCAACAHECPGAIVLGEPVARNTAPAIAAALEWLDDDDALAVMPADHAIDDTDAFAVQLARAFDVVERESVLMTFGIRPTGPETNFGYIRRGEEAGSGVHRVREFTEKPDRERAARWVAEGDRWWNSGIFLWRRGVFFDALERGRPAIARALRQLGAGRDPRRFTQRLAEAFPALESISVDYAVLEPAPNACVMAAEFDWDDLGSWSAWARRQPRDAAGNVCFGQALAIDCERCVVVGDGGPAAAIGLRDMIVVHAEGATLSCPLAASERVREIPRALSGGSK